MDIWVILEYTMSVTVIGLLIWLIKRIFHDKLDARWHYFIWLVLLVRIVVPVQFRMISTPLSVFQEIPVGTWMEMGRIVAEKKGFGGLFDALGTIYLWGAVLLAVFYILMWVRLRVQVARAPRADEAVREYVNQVAVKYGLRSCEDIRVLRSGTPYVCGVVRPVLVLSAGGEMPEESVIVHELLHKRYHDVLVNIGIHVVRVVNWFNPCLWIVTGVVLNDSEALCDQRVLECCKEESEAHYGELLIAMGEGNGRNPVKIGTSNMASSYRNMKTRISRIRDFRCLPKGIGLVTLCITLMLAAASVGNAEEIVGFEMPPMNTARNLERALLYARCYHAHTPEEAVWLFLRAYEENNVAYRMAVMPEAEIAGYEAFVQEWFSEGKDIAWVELSQKRGDPAYFPQETSSMTYYRVYNMQYDENSGSATVCAVAYGEQGEAFIEWSLALKNENGWKVWLEESKVSEEYYPQPLLETTVQLGDFFVEVSGYNEGKFQQLGTSEGVAGFSLYQVSKEVEPEWPTSFSTECKLTQVYISYLGEESLAGHSVRVVVSDREEDAEGSSQHSGHESHGWAMKEETMPEDGTSEPLISSYDYSDNDGNSNTVFDGAKLMAGKVLVRGGGNSFEIAGSIWKPDDQISVHVWIYVDETLVAEGDV